MKKRFAMLAAAALTAAVLAGCGEEPAAPGGEAAPTKTESVQEPVKTEDPVQENGGEVENTEPEGNGEAVTDVSADAIYAEIEAQFELPDLYLGDADWIMNNYGLDASALDSYVCAEGDELHADRIFIIKTKGGNDVADVEGKLESVYGQLSSQEMLDYLPDQADMIKAASVKKSGDYVYLVISPDMDAIEAIITSMIG